MARYIDVDREINGLKCALGKGKHSEFAHLAMESFIEALQKAPTADVVEVKRGEWKRNERNIPKMREFHEKGNALSMSEKSIFYTCSCCDSWGSLTQKYCFECGAKMDGERGDT